MFSNLSIFKTASALAGHAATRQSAITQNIANADTPGYRATDLAPFSEVFEKPSVNMPLRATRVGHFQAESSGSMRDLQEIERPGDESPNGNTVSLETEMVNAADVKFSHDLALTVYRSGLNILRTSLGSGS